jgi:hypothetical protein
MIDRRPQLKLIAHAASAVQAAAIAAALERFMRATAPPRQPSPEVLDPWRRAAVVEGISREPQDDLADPWINT